MALDDVEPLAYPSDALEPTIDKQTMEIHHGKHHAAYVDQLQQGPRTAAELDGKPLHEVLANNCRSCRRRSRPPSATTAAERTITRSSGRFSTPRANPGGTGRQARRGDQQHLRRVRSVQGKVHRRRQHAASARAGRGW